MKQRVAKEQAEKRKGPKGKEQTEMSRSLPCPQCGSKNTRWYDGALGYEAIRCYDCNIESDANSDNYGPIPGREHLVTKDPPTNVKPR